ncbi:MAG: hypothetical protein HUJ73_03725 [Eubacterium sp.]|nr:hypothetical protein [Eubacterium sp.]
MSRSVLDFESRDRIESPEKIDKYIRVANPAIWALVLAMLILVGGVFIWGFTGRIPLGFTTSGVIIKNEAGEGQIVVLVDASEYSGGELMNREVTFRLPDNEERSGVVVGTSDLPRSQAELREIANSDFLVSNLSPDRYYYIVTIDADTDITPYRGSVASVQITTEEIPPIHFLFKR